MESKKEIYWVNAAKAICMICVFWGHSEAYTLFQSDFSISPWIHPFYVNAFFIISGYLFFRNIKRMEAKKNLCNVLFRLVIPTVLFSSIFFIPKSIFHDSGFSFSRYCFFVLGGISYWFTSAIAVTQIVMIAGKTITGCERAWHYIIFTIMLIFILVGGLAESPFPWYWRSGLCGCFLFAMGGCYLAVEAFAERYQWLLFSLATIGIIIIGAGKIFSPLWIMMSCRFTVSGFFLMAASSFILIFISKRIPVLSALNYIGKNSIVFYFFSGVYPAFCGTAIRKMIPSFTNYGSVLAVMTMSLFLAGISCFLICRFMPFMLDVRKLKISLGFLFKKR